MSPARVLLAGFGGVAGHLTRLLVVADAIREIAPAQVTVLGAGRFSPLVRDAGFAVEGADDRPLDLFDIADRDLAVRVLRAWFRLTLADDLATLERVRPDCVVVDSRWPTMAAARQLGLPTVAISNVVWTRHRRALALANEEHFGQFAAVFAEAVTPTLAALDHTIPPELEAFQEGDHTHLADLSALLGPAQTLSGSLTIGPLVWRPTSAAAVEWPPGSGPKVYVTSGSTGMRAMIEASAERLARVGCRVVLSGAAIDSAGPNLVRTRFCDASRLLRSADAAVLHGGSGSLYQALEHGVPVVICPANLDQVAHGELLHRSRAGISVTPASAAKVVAAVEQIRSEPGFRSRAQRLAASIASEATTTELAGAIVSAAAGVPT